MFWRDFRIPHHVFTYCLCLLKSEEWRRSHFIHLLISEGVVWMLANVCAQTKPFLEQKNGSALVITTALFYWLDSLCSQWHHLILPVAQTCSFERPSRIEGRKELLLRFLMSGPCYHSSIFRNILLVSFHLISSFQRWIDCCLFHQGTTVQWVREFYLVRG